MKKIIFVLVIAIALLFIVGIAKDQVLKSIITVAATKITGVPVHIDGFSLGIFSQSIKIKGFKIYNPKDFSKSILLDSPKINIVYDLGALFSGKIHLVNAEIELKEMIVEKNKDGKLNVDTLKIAKQTSREEGKSSKYMPIAIDRLKLDIGKIILKDYYSQVEPRVSVHDVNLHKSYKNITSVQQLAVLILTEPMKAAGIQGAKIYGVSVLAGVAILPVALAATFISKDSVHQDFMASFDEAYNVSLSILEKMGKVTKINKASGIINANINSSQIVLKIKKESDGKTEIIISARKHFLPKPEIAGGILYKISEKLK